MCLSDERALQVLASQHRKHTSRQAGRQACVRGCSRYISLKVCLLTSVIKTSSGVTKTIRHVPHTPALHGVTKTIRHVPHLVFPVVRSVGIFQQVRRKLLCNIPIGWPSIGRCAPLPKILNQTYPG